MQTLHNDARIELASVADKSSPANAKTQALLVARATRRA